MSSEPTTGSCTVVTRLARVAAVLIFAPVFLLGATGSTIQTLSASINAIGKVSVPVSVTLTTAGTTFVAYSGALTVSYKARTTAGGGSHGSLTMQSTADFSPAGGPSIASGQLTYTCGAASLGVGCSGPLTVSAAQTNVVTLGASECTGGGGSCSAATSNTVQTTFTLSNNPAYKTGTYSATLTFTISAI